MRSDYCIELFRNHVAHFGQLADKIIKKLMFFNLLLVL